MTTASMNAVTHGLFSREVVLPTHGEAPAEYAEFLEELTRDLRPQNVLERHCVQTIAAALWRLRRFHRWEAAHAPDPALPPDDQFQKMERAFRAEAGLHRRINTALKQLGRDLPDLLQTRARLPSPDGSSDQPTLHTTQNCQNEPPTALAPNLPFRGDPVNEVNKERGHPTPNTKNCQNEPIPPLLREAAADLAIGLSPSLLGERWRSRIGGLPDPPRADRGPDPSQLDLIRAARARQKAAKGLHRV